MRRRLLCNRGGNYAVAGKDFRNDCIIIGPSASQPTSLTIKLCTTGGEYQSNDIVVNFSSYSEPSKSKQFSIRKEHVDAWFKKYKLPLYGDSKLSSSGFYNALTKQGHGDVQMKIISGLERVSLYEESSRKKIINNSLTMLYPAFFYDTGYESGPNEQDVDWASTSNSTYFYTNMFAFKHYYDEPTDMVSLLDYMMGEGDTAFWSQDLSRDGGNVRINVVSYGHNFTVKTTASGCYIGTTTSSTSNTYTYNSENAFGENYIYLIYNKWTAANGRTILVTITDDTDNKNYTIQFNVPSVTTGGSSGGGESNMIDFSWPIYFRRQYYGGSYDMENSELRYLVQNIKSNGEIEIILKEYQPGNSVYAEYISDSMEDNAKNFSIDFSLPKTVLPDYTLYQIKCDVKVKFRDHNFSRYNSGYRYFDLSLYSGSSGDISSDEGYQYDTNSGTTTFTFSNVYIYGNIHFFAYFRSW